MSSLPENQAEAEAELRSIFLSKKWRFCYIGVDEDKDEKPSSGANDASASKNLVDHVLDILQKYPDLARARFETGLARNITPLVCFCCVRSGSVPIPREVLQTVYDLNPGAAVELQSRSQQRTPLSLACLLHAPTEVIRFLLEKNPDTRSVKSVEGTFPVETVVSSRLWWATVGIPLTLNLCPPGVDDLRFGERKSSLLEQALHCGFSVEDIRLIAEKYPPVHLTVPDTASIDSSKSEFLASMLRRLKSFTNYAQLWSLNAVETFLTHLGGNTYTTNVVLLLRPRAFSMANFRLGAVLQKNTTIESFSLKTPVSDTSIGIEILDGLRYNQTLRELRLEGFGGGVWRENGTNGTKSAVTTLSLKNSRMRGSCLVAVLSLFPKLETLKLDDVEIVSNEKDRTLEFNTKTSFLIHVLGIRSLASLSVTTHWASAVSEVASNSNCPSIRDDTPLVVEALKRNNSLKRYAVQASLTTYSGLKKLEDVLLGANTTLECIDPCCYCGINIDRTKSNILIKSNIMYLINLNKWGRGIARAPDTKKETFVNLLARLNEDASSHELDDNQRHMIRYGLLQEGLVLWAMAS